MREHDQAVPIGNRFFGISVEALFSEKVLLGGGFVVRGVLLGSSMVLSGERWH